MNSTQTGVKKIERVTLPISTSKLNRESLDLDSIRRILDSSWSVYKAEIEKIKLTK